MKKLLLSISLLMAVASFGQAAESELINVTSAVANKAKDTTNMGWKRGGTFTLLFNQSAFNNNWLGGGTSNMAGNLGLNYNINYKSEKAVWDNKLMIAYGLTKTKDADMVKSDDRVELTSVYGQKAKGLWFYSAFLNFKTQMDRGEDSNGVFNSHFFSPAYLQVGPGFLWKKSENLKVNIAPATSRLIYVSDYFTQSGSAFGVEQGQSLRFEFGTALNAYYKITLMENVTMENILNLYSNYLDNPQNVDIDYQMNLVMKINKYMSANLAFQAIYDDNATKGFQIKEVFGLGVNFGI
jgi:hypothetical protein